MSTRLQHRHTIYARRACAGVSLWIPSRAERAFRLAVGVLVLLATWFGVPELAQAKSPMCGDSAESIAAPPPLVASRSTMATTCDSEQDLKIGAVPRSEPHPRLTAEMEKTQPLALLPSSLQIARFTVSATWPIGTSTRLKLSEHRWDDGRPPSSP